MSKPVEINGITFAPESFDFLSKYTEIEFEDQNDRSLVDCDIEAIGELQTFFISNWDDMPDNTTSEKVKEFVQSLHFIKNNLLRIRKLIKPRKK